MTNYTKKDLIYAAGFFDGEGCITSSEVEGKNVNTYSIKVALAQTEKDILNWFTNKFGGKIAAGSNKHLTTVDGYIRSKINKWSLSGTRAVEFICLLEPYLKQKKEQAQLALDWGISDGVVTPDDRRTREKIYHGLKMLKHKYKTPETTRPRLRRVR